jgi:hypothetical protein
MTEQVYSASARVKIEPQGFVTEDVVEVVLTEEKERIDSAKIKLDTSKNAHGINENKDVDVWLEQDGTQKHFTGKTDKIKDSPDQPVVTVEARAPAAPLSDTTAVGEYLTNTVWGVIYQLIEREPGKVRGINFDRELHEDRYGTFSNRTDFGNLYINTDFDTFRFNTFQDLPSGEEKPGAFEFSGYDNQTSETYSVTIIGKDKNDDTVEATLDIPPGTDVENVLGGSNVPPDSVSGGTEKFNRITDYDTSIPQNPPSRVLIQFDFINYFKTNFRFEAVEGKSVKDALDNIASLISAEDGQRWEYIVDDSQDLIFRPVSERPEPSRYLAKERDNVIRPVAQISLDNVANFVTVEGANDVKVWAYAYQEDFYISDESPLEFGLGVGDVFDSSGGVNDIDQINLRSPGDANVKDDNINSEGQAEAEAKDLLRRLYRTSVSGTAPFAGLKEIKPRDELEVFYPSRGIPQRVADPVFEVEKVEWRVRQGEAVTEADFSVRRTDAEEAIRNVVSDTISDSDVVQNKIEEAAGGGSGGGGGDFPVKGTITKVYDSGKVKIETASGETFDNVEIV